MRRKMFVFLSLLVTFVMVQSEFVNPLAEFHIEQLQEEFVRNMSKTGNDKCASQFNSLVKANLTTTMFDAWGKFPYTGMLYASKMELGNFDECISIDHHDGKERILGKYCAFGYVLPANLELSNIYILATCIPDACVSLLQDFSCTTKDDNKELDAGAIVTLVIICLTILCMIVSTIYDVYLYMNEKKPPHPIIVAFSVFTNGRRLFKTSKSSGEQILCFNGLKFISIAWIIAGHGAAPWQAVPTTYGDAYSEWFNTRASQYLQTAKYGVDTFFFISGFLTAYQYFKSSVNKPVLGQVMGVPLMVIHRYIRLTSPVLMLFLYVVYLARFVGEGPLFGVGQNTFIQPCKDNWWAFFLYIQNYHNPDKLCITATWYLSADMQLFLFAIPVTILLSIKYKDNFKVVFGGLFVLNLIFATFPILTKLYLTRDSDPTLSSEYDGHSRLTGYFIGFMLGMYVRHNKTKFRKINKVLNLFLWATTLVLMYLITYITHGIMVYNGYVAKAVSVTIARPLWCIGLCWIVFSCLNGQGGPVNWFLSCNLMQIGAKLSYCLYLMHGPVISMYLLQTRDTLKFSDYILFYQWCGHFIVTILVATFWTLAFETPIMIIEKTLLGGLGQKKHQPKIEPMPEKKTDAAVGDTIPPESVNG